MDRLTLICFATLLAAILPAEAEEYPIESLSLAQLEQRRTEIDSELSQLSRLSLRSGVGSRGTAPPGVKATYKRNGLKSILGKSFRSMRLCWCPL